jgi:hypothetical protein
MLGKLGSWYNFGRWRTSRNVISGMEGSDRLLAFDAVVGSGRRSFVQTWVARRSSTAPQPPPLAAGALLYRQLGPWRAVAQKRTLLGGTRISVPKIEELWQQLR